MSDKAKLAIEALEDIYGKGGMVRSCGESLVKELSRWEQEAAEGWRSVEHNIHLYIWNWFPGGDTAEIAARQVVDALGYERDDEV